MFYLESMQDKIYHQKYGDHHLFTVADRYCTIGGKNIEYILSVRVPYRFLGILFYRWVQIASYYPSKVDSVDRAVKILSDIAERNRMKKVKARNKKKALLNIK